MKKAEEELLEKHGWVVECESPLEIRHEESNSFATHWGALMVLDYFKEHPNMGTRVRKSKAKLTVVK